MVWRDVILGDVAEEITVGYVGSMASEYVSSGIPFLRSQNVTPLRIDLKDVKYISPEFHVRLRKSTLKPGDVVIVRTGKPGAAAVIPNDLQIANCSDLVIIRPGSEINSRFLAYYINTMASHHVASHLVGAVQQHFNVASAKSLRLKLPPLDVQQSIVHILGSLDDRIDLNRQMNATLQTTSRAIFQSWFLDFDPVRAKAEGKQPFGMDREVAALFPDSFDESEMGKIPQGWGVMPLDKIANFLNGLALQKYPPKGDRYLPVIKIADMRRGNTEGSDRASADLPSEYVVHDGDVLFSWSGSLEVMLWCGGDGALNQHLFKVTSDEFPKWFYYLWTRHHLAEFQAIAAGKATTMGHIQRHHLSDAKVVVPPTALLEKMSIIIAPLIDAETRNNLESRTLIGLRDTLLPKLLSGELSIPAVAQ